MRTRFIFATGARSGYALLMVFCMIAVSAVIMAATLKRTSTSELLNARNVQFSVGTYAAESACEKVMARMRYDYLNGGIAAVTNNMASGLYATNIPTSGENAYWANFQFSDGQGNLGKTYVACISNTVYGPLQSQYPGLYSFYPTYRVLSDVSQINGFAHNLTNAVQEDVTLNAVPIFQYAIFYNQLLEFSTAATMTVNGRVHANGNIYTGSGSALTFNGTVTTTGTITSPANAGSSPPWSYTGVYNGSPGYSTNVPYVLLPLGTNNVYSIIQMPPAGESPLSSLGQQRLYNEAQVLLLVSNTTATVILQASPNGQNPGSDPSPKILTYTNLTASYLNTNLPFLTTNTFHDNRENKTVLATQIDVAKYATWLTTNSWIVGASGKFPAGSGTYPTILYVADNRNNSASQLSAVRLTNGLALPVNGGNGFSVATPNPLYVWGNYNQTNSSLIGTTNTSSGTVPSALMSDALTILSANWADSKSSSYSGENTPGNTTINAAIITGIVPSTGTTTANFSGGVHNLPRLLENWTSETLTLNTSIVNLYNSQKANSVFIWPGTTYSPPTRQFSFDQNFVNPAKQPPPGCPMLAMFLRSSWAAPPPNTINYYVTP